MQSSNFSTNSVFHTFKETTTFNDGMLNLIKIYILEKMATYVKFVIYLSLLQLTPPLFSL